MLIRVALPVPLYRIFDYLPPTTKDYPANDSLVNDSPANESLAKDNNDHPQAINNETLPCIGARVQVSFGYGGRKLIGIVVAHIDNEQSAIALNKLKPILKVYDNEPLLDKTMLALGHWLARYYHYPLGDVLSVMLPTLIRQGKPLDMFVMHWRILPNVDDSAFTAQATRQKQQFNMLKLHGKNGASEDTLLLEGMERTFLKTLETKGLVEHYLEPRPFPKLPKLAKMPLDLNAQQDFAVKSLVSAFESQQYQGFLLNGVTGSGKTEVYLQAMHPVLAAGKQVLVLVPEIGLMPQTKARFAQRFAANILLLHSGINNTQRMQGWEDCRQGRAQIIIGTRSLVLYPYANLGLIVVDEAHDASFKQQDTLRYHAANVALYRAYQLKIPIVLGTATPSLEHLKLVYDDKLTELRLSMRAGHAKTATMQLVDARDKLTQYSNQAVDDNQTPLIANIQGVQNTGLTDDIISAIRHTLEAGEQVLVFLNRRGYAPILLCDACGWQADCVRCEAHLTVHHSHLDRYQPSYLKCHHCDWQAAIPTLCPNCASTNLDAIGIGTTRLSESLHALFSNPQTSKKTYPIIQIDRDTTRRKDSWENIYKRINTGDPAILVGTQMLAKGHHFPQVTLVCMPNADRGFLSADFRSPEHTAQLIIQVAGRAGRGHKPGRVLIQTLQPENPLLLKLVKEGYLSFAQELLKERQIMGLPPYSYSALIRCEGKTLQRTTKALEDALAILPTNALAILGPIDAPMKKKNSRYHSQILLLAKQRSHLHPILASWWPKVLDLPATKYMKLTLDIDPISW